MTEIAQDLARAEAMLQVKRYDEAARMLARIVAAQPGESRAWCLLATAHLSAGRYQDATAAANQAIACAPSDDWPYRLVSVAEEHLGNAQAAVRAAREACRLAPNEWRAWVCLAQAALATGVDFDVAERAAATARGLAPDESDAHYTSGRVSFAREQWRAALAHQQRALALNPAHSGALNELGRISLKRRNAARAANHFVQAASTAPGVSAYGHNVDVAVRSLIAQVIYLATFAAWVLVLVTNYVRASRPLAVSWLGAIALLSAVLAAVRLWAVPPAARPLIRRRRTALAVGVVYGSIIVAIIVAAATPASSLRGALIAAGVLVIASRFVAHAILRRKRR